MDIDDLAALLCEDIDSSRSIVFGRYEIMSKIIPALGNKIQHMKSDDTHVFKSTNPDLLTVLDDSSKLVAYGSNNCVTCKFFVANELCPRWAEAGREIVLNAKTVYDLSVGGCVLQSMLDSLDDNLYDEIREFVQDNNIVVFNNGSYKMLSPDDFGIDLSDTVDKRESEMIDNSGFDQAPEDEYWDDDDEFKPR